MRLNKCFIVIVVLVLVVALINMNQVYVLNDDEVVVFMGLVVGGIMVYVVKYYCEYDCNGWNVILRLVL